MTQAFDPFTLEILWNRLIAITDEAAATLIRTSFSTLVRESYDFSCVLTDRHGHSLAQASLSIPSFIGTLPRTVKLFLQKFPPESLRPGDVLITNDMWLGTGHLPDINVVKPVFRGGELIAFAGSVAHAPDIGGKIRSPDPREVFEEGLQIPMMKLYEAGRPNTVLMELIRYNVRVPDQVMGDLDAQLSALAAEERRLVQLMEEHELDSLEALAATIHRLSEQAMREAIAAVPDGVYENEVQTDGLAVPVRLHVRLTVTGDAMHVDYAGSSEQVDRALNVVPSYRDAYTMYPLKCMLSPRVPNNEGAWRPITIDAPEGSILNPRYPAAGGTRVLVGHYLPTLLFGALARALPDRVMAATGSPVWCINLGGEDRRGRRFATMFFFNGGTGAAASRDGHSCLTFPSNISNTPIEIMETTAPVRILEKRLLPDSGGAGEFRGGLGQVVTLRNLSARPISASFLAERTRFAAPGLLGGKAGAPGRVVIGDRTVDPKITHIVEPGGVIELTMPGGGGFGDPGRRTAARRREDAAAGYVTP